MKSTLLLIVGNTTFAIGLLRVLDITWPTQPLSISFYLTEMAIGIMLTFVGCCAAHSSPR